MRRGADRFRTEFGEEFDWPRCEMTGCPNNVCLGMSKSLCYTHGIELGAFTKEEFDRARAIKTILTLPAPRS